MNVLSLFDGMSCGQIALDQLGIKVDNYFAAEIDKYAIKVSQQNFPGTIHLGDVKDIKGTDLPEIDLLIGGSPCQGFSFAGKNLNFDDPRSKLFFEYARLLKELKPKYFLLENVRMKKESMDVISEYLGVEPIAINSNLVSAQNRYRLYWTNIPMEGLPQDKGIMLKDILEPAEQIDDAYYYSNKSIFYKGVPYNYFDDNRDPLILQKARGYNKGGLKALNGKTPTLSTSSWEHNNHLVNPDKSIRKLTVKECERLQTVPDGYTCGVSNTQRYKMLGNGWTVGIIKHIFKQLQMETVDE